MTPRQRDCLEAIKKFIDEHGYSPSMREIASDIGVKSQSAVLRIMRQLREMGCINYEDKKNRSVRLPNTKWLEYGAVSDPKPDQETAD